MIFLSHADCHHFIIDVMKPTDLLIKHANEEKKEVLLSEKYHRY
jgi:hypothetical protein